MDRKDKKEKVTNKKSMIKTPLIYLICVSAATAVIIMSAYLQIQYRSIVQAGVNNINNFEGTCKFMLSKVDATSAEVEDELCVPARLTASALRQTDSGTEPGSYGSGWIIRRSGGAIEFPEDYPGELRFEAAGLPEDFDSIHAGSKVVSCAKISGDTYYVELQESGEEAEAIHDGVNYQAALDDYASAKGCDFISFSSDGKEDYDATAGTGKYAGTQKASDLGFTELIDRTGDIGNTIMSVDGRRCMVVCSREFSIPFEADEAAVMILPLRDILLRSIALTGSLVFFILLVCVTLAVWIISVYRRLRSNAFSKDKIGNYTYVKVRRKVIVAICAATLAAYLLSLFAMSLDDLFIQTSTGNATLKAYFSRLDGDEERSRAQWKGSQERYTENARKLANLIDSNRSLQTNAAWLDEASDIIDADYIMIFDENGEELISDSPYRGIVLEGHATPEMADFSRLFNGVDNISHPKVRDEVTGLTRDFHGVCLRYLADDDSYGALLVAVDPAEHSWIDFNDYDDIAKSMVTDDSLLIQVDPKTGAITHASDKSLIGTHIKKAALSESFMDFLDLKGRLCFAMARLHDSKYYYYGMDKKVMFIYDTLFCLCYTLIFLLTCGVLAFMLVRKHPYRKAYEDRGEPGDSAADRLDTLSEFILNTAENHDSLMNLGEPGFAGKKTMSEIYKDITPEREALAIFELLLSVFTLAVSLLVITHSGEGTAFQFITSGRWVHGFNLFAIAAIFFLFCNLVVFLAILRLVSVVIEKMLSSRSLTIAALILNVVWYAAVVAFIIFSLGYLGVNTRTLIASVGFIGLAISMGLRDIISDMLAGISIITGRSFEVGDTIEIKGFGTGTVRMIGLRSTQLRFADGTDSYIRNSRINGVVNLSRDRDNKNQSGKANEKTK
ncbi:MAG: mechanosensitive ion channel [Clostridiales bacterium]|nr:mechanosensitive ion channel [Clostridiales bacterium]